MHRKGSDKIIEENLDLRGGNVVGDREQGYIGVGSQNMRLLMEDYPKLGFVQNYHEFQRYRSKMIALAEEHYGQYLKTQKKKEKEKVMQRFKTSDLSLR